MNVFEELRQDHDVQRGLLDQLAQTSGDDQVRRQGFARLKSELTLHAAAEEKWLYARMMQHDATQEKARHSVAEHHDMDECVEKLEGIDFDSPQWLKTFKDLQHLVTHHLDEEEQEVFQAAGKVLTENQKEDLGKHYRNEMDSNRDS